MRLKIAIKVKVKVVKVEKSWLCVLIMSHTRFRVKLLSAVGYGLESLCSHLNSKNCFSLEWLQIFTGDCLTISLFISTAGNFWPTNFGFWYCSYSKTVEGDWLVNITYIYNLTENSFTYVIRKILNPHQCLG